MSTVRQLATADWSLRRPTSLPTHLFLLRQRLEQTLQFLLSYGLVVSLNDEPNDVVVGKFKLLEKDVDVHAALHVQ